MEIAEYFKDLKMQNKTTYRLRRKTGLLVFLFFLFGVQIMIAGDGDKPKKAQYDLNDPRNPDCPCHKYQKLADEEFMRLLKKDKGVSLSTEQVVNTGSGGGGNISKRHHSGYQKITKRWQNKKWHFFNKGRSGKKGRKHHFGRDISSCFHW